MHKLNTPFRRKYLQKCLILRDAYCNYPEKKIVDLAWEFGYSSAVARNMLKKVGITKIPRGKASRIMPEAPICFGECLETL